MNNFSRLQQRILPAYIAALFFFLVSCLWGCASTQETTTQNQSLQNRQRGVAQIIYLGWSGWAIQTKNHFLIFDDITGEKHIRVQRFANANVIIFISHGHKDHYDSSVYNWKKQMKNIHYVSGYSDTNAANSLIMEGRQEIQADDVKITSIPATDAGVGFLVEVDDLLIFHAGDHANWGGSSFADFNWGIDYLAKKVSNIDLMFMPIATGNGEMRDSIYDGVVYAIEKLRPKAMFPMHGRAHLLKSFKEKFDKENHTETGAKIHAPKMDGKAFTYLNGLIF